MPVADAYGLVYSVEHIPATLPVLHFMRLQEFIDFKSVVPPDRSLSGLRASAPKYISTLDELNKIKLSRFRLEK